MRLAIVGTGYVGLVTGTCFAEMGNTVQCVDIDVEKVRRLRAGELPIFEPGLHVYFERNLREHRLFFTTELEQAVRDSEVIFLALPTPSDEDGSADLSYVLGVAEALGPMLREQGGYKIVVNKSTVPVGTADRVRAVLTDAGLTPGEDFDVVSNPEFLREGVAVDDFMKPERVVIGSSSPKATAVMQRLYEPFVRNGNPIFAMDERSAELTKYAANAFLATKITFVNEIANVCAEVGANVDQVRRAMGADSRIGNKFLYPGIGFGGSCFPKDVRALVHTAHEHGYPFQTLEAVLRVNERQQTWLVPRISDAFGGSLEGLRLAVWGLAFKPNTDDVREASAHATIRALLERGARVSAFDPEALETTRAVFGNRIGYVDDMYDVLEGADALVICTEWHEFRRPDFDRMRQALARPLVFDGRNLYEPAWMAEAGFAYFSIGRPHVPPDPRPAAEPAASTNGRHV